MQTQDKLGNVLNSLVGSKKEIEKKVHEALSDPRTDKIVISDFKKGEKIEVKGLKFRIKTINARKKTMFIKMI